MLKEIYPSDIVDNSANLFNTPDLSDGHPWEQLNLGGLAAGNNTAIAYGESGLTLEGLHIKSEFLDAAAEIRASDLSCDSDNKKACC